ncbi:DUF2953 domain-containing protein [Tumebacillus lipolyticus]|uniref:DUF2953 domain-containing protein n=1 Tax=Tumebacillus lipolyticus TaxID=1280370 RepID=A0ABW4ZTB2_9BACL
MKWLWGLLLALAIVFATLFLLLHKMFAWYWIVLLALAVFLLFAMVLPVTIEVQYRREGRNDRLHVGVRALFGLIRLGYEVPTVALLEQRMQIGFKRKLTAGDNPHAGGWVTITVEKIQQFQRQVDELRARIGKYKRALRRFTKSFHIESLRWRTAFGTGDAAQTGSITGMAWAVKGSLASILYRQFTVESSLRYTVQPNFQAKGFRTDLVCIIRFLPGKAILAGLTLAFLWLREGAKWRNIRSKA